jgi:hypothetical protein
MILMANYSQRTITTTVVEFSIPLTIGFGACWVEVTKAIRAAHTELWDLGRVEHGRDAPDDVIRLTTGDDEIIVFYERHRVETNE